jgi:protein AATF/BFR2
MVPIPVAGTWHEEQIDELFGSLLGNGFESLETDSRIEDRIAGDGFRVF